MLSLAERRELLNDMGAAAIKAANPKGAVKKSIRVTENLLTIGLWSRELSEIDRVMVVGSGKASGPMAQGAEEALGDRLTAGLVTTKYRHTVPTRSIEVVEAGHPIPDENGVEAASRLLDMISGLTERDVVVVLLSGGGSALTTSPAEGISLPDKQCVTEQLLRSGAAIDEINCVRKHLSRFKGGQLARACGDATVITLILSDVIGDPVDVIASGPTAPDPTTFEQARDILVRYDLLDAVPDSVQMRIGQGVNGDVPETPKPSDPLFEHTFVELIGTNRIALAAAERSAAAAGYEARVLTSTLRGEALHVAQVVCSLAEGARAEAQPIALVLGGETTVTLGREYGKGGRNQELALSAAIEIDRREDIVVMSLGTDGSDGPTNAAGGIVDGGTVARARESGFTPEEHLARHDAYPLLAATGDLVITGPTGTNVMDMVAVLVG